MKKSLLIAAAVLITFGACTNDDSAPVQNEISFKAVNYKSTRAAINDVAYPKGIPFKIFAYYLPADKEWPTNIADAQTYMSNITVSCLTGENIFKTLDTEKYYWPNKGKLTFVAYTPATASGSCTIDEDDETSLVISEFSCGAVTTGDFSAQSDLMYSCASEAQNKTNNVDPALPNTYDNGVVIKFHHALSQLRFFAKPFEASTTTQFNVLKVELKKIQNKGNLTIVNDVITGWDVSADVKADFTTYDQTITPYNNQTGVVLPMDAASYTRIGGNDNNLLVIPQKFFIADGVDVDLLPDFISDCEIVVTYRMWVNGNIDAGIEEKSVLVKDIITEFLPNKIYNMNFSISADEILFAPEIVSWDDPVEGTNGELE